MGHCPCYLPAVYADENRLQQIFYNLVGNAIKFTDSGFVKVSAVLESSFIKIQVEDSGIGISPDKFDVIFQSFSQLDSSMESKYRGSGLGLSITKQLIELHDGNIWVETQIGSGSIFFVRLPATKDIPISSRETISGLVRNIDIIYESANMEEIIPISGVHSDKPILIADDERVNRNVLKNILTLRSMNILEATNGYEVLRILNEYKPDRILLDVMMPGLNGFDVCKKNREWYTMLQLPVIMLTAKNRIEDLVLGLESGANDYLAKPFSRQELMARIHTLLELKQSMDVNAKLNNYKYEIEMAMKIQDSIISKQNPDLPGLKVASKYLPASLVGGDIYDYHIFSQGLGIFSADVSGHGLPAAMFSGMTKLAFSMLANQESNPARVLEQLNSSLLGHTPLLIHHRVSDEVEIINPKGKLLGVFERI